MSHTLMHDQVNLQHPTIFLKDYTVPDFLIDEIKLIFDLKRDVTWVTSKMKVRHNKNAKSSSRDLVLNGEELELVSIKVDGNLLQPKQYMINGNYLTISNLSDMAEVEIVNKIYPDKNTALSGLYLSNGKYCTQCEAEGFRRITYFLDRPDVLSRYETEIRADKAKFPYLLSNGNLVAQGELPDGRHFAKWSDPFKKPCYLFALVAGDFDLLEDQFTTMSSRVIKLQVYVEKGYLDQTHHAMLAVKEAMRWDENAYGREYDLDNYMIVAVSDFNMGAMENKGLNIFNTKYVLAKPETATDDDYIHILSVVAHEYFHNWTGNRVTCRDWFQLSLKEGLTIFRDQSFSEDTLSRSVMRIKDVIALRESQFPEDAGPLSHPVRPDSYIEINNFYTATVYNKGAEVLRMLQTILGKTQFRRAMDLYFEKYDGMAVTIDDYVRVMEETSGLDLTQFKLWYSQAGTPQISVTSTYDAGAKKFKLTLTQVTQSTPGQPTKLPLHIPIKTGLLSQAGKALPIQFDGKPVQEECVLHLTANEQSFEFVNIADKPIPSLLREYSAPVRLVCDYSDDELVALAMHDHDAFNRYEACQNYALKIIMTLIDDLHAGKKLVMPEKFARLYQALLGDKQLDSYFVAEMLLLPSEKYIAEQMNVVDVDAIFKAREFLLESLATTLELQFKSIYDGLSSIKMSGFSIENVGRRQLKNRVLGYLAHLPKHRSLAMSQFNESLTTNMTDSLAALSALSQYDDALREEALKRFYDTWQNDPLVVDKWLHIQAASKVENTLKQVMALTSHKAFDIKNPNKVYALIGGFSHRNQVRFHAVSGEGYAFLRVITLQLDKLNPQVAARMMKPLTEWRRYDKERQRLMKNELQNMLADKTLSPDVFELATKSI